MTEYALERRVVTTLSCGITHLPAAGEGEAIAPFVAEIVAILQVMGASVTIESDTIVAARFGSLDMSETGAERAVLAAFDLVTAKQANPQFESIDLRVGIATGLVWGRFSGPEADGAEFPTVVAIQASALRELADRDSILITESTKSFVKGLFEYAPGEPILLRNFSEPVRAFTVLRPSGTENRFEALHSQRLRFLDRERELVLLAELWRRVQLGEGQVAFVSGDVGIGKSRLVAEFDRRMTVLPTARMRLFGSPNHSSSVLYPFARLLERLCFFARDDAPSSRTEKLRDFLISIGLRSSMHAAVFARFLGLPAANGELPAEVPARRYRELILEAFVGLVKAQARRGAIIIIFEDLHWADPTSRDLLERLVRDSAALPLMIFATARPEYKSAWLNENNVLTLPLNPLTPAETADLISIISKSPDLVASLRDPVAECTGGVPLFVEELTKVLIETGFSVGADKTSTRSMRFSFTALPIDVHAALLARIERLAEGKTVARFASVLGQRFSHTLLDSLAGISPAELNLGLARLIDAGLILRRGSPPNADYLFKHSLVQEAAYSSLPGAERKALHERAATLLQSTGNDGPTEPELIALHLTQAGKNEAASVYWLLAGLRALSRSANPEAIEHFKAGLKAVRKGAPTPDRDSRERHLLVGLGASLMAVNGYAAEEGHAVFKLAAALIDEATPVSERLHILCGLWGVRLGRSELYDALRLAQQHYDLAQASGLSLNLTDCMMGRTLAAMGELKQAQYHLLAVVRRFRERESEPDKPFFAADEHILAQTYLGRVLWALGYPDQGAAATEEALERAWNGADAVSIAIAYAGTLHMATHRGEIEEAAAKIAEAEAHCSGHGLHLFEDWMSFNRGALMAKMGDAARGIKVMQSAIAAADARLSRQFGVFQRSCIAEAYLSLGSLSETLATANEALLLAEKTGERLSEAGVRRVRAEALMGLGRFREGQRELQTALEVARRQGARIEELRVATTMAHHASDTEELTAASHALRAVYSTFKEGHNLPDLLAAKKQLTLLKFPRS